MSVQDNISCVQLAERESAGVILGEHVGARGANAGLVPSKGVKGEEEECSTETAVACWACSRRGLGLLEVLEARRSGSRRHFGASLALDACGSSGTVTTTQTPTSQKPKPGGTLRAGLTGGGAQDTFNPNVAATYPAFAGFASIYDTLISTDDHMQYNYSAASEVSSNSDATVWTIRLRPGITFHNGKDATADDLIATLQWTLGAKVPSPYAGLLPFDLANMKKLDRLTLRVPCKVPWSIVREVLPTNYTFPLLPVGFDPNHPIGTGPFKFVSHTPGQQLVVTRNARIIG